MSHGHAIDLARVDAATAQSVADTMRVLATPSRVRILSRLGAGPSSVTELAGTLGMSQPAVSQQLRVLRYLGLVIGMRSGRKVVYELHDDHVRSLLAEAISHTEHIRLGARAHADAPGLGARAHADAPEVEAMAESRHGAAA
jgi:ArsR family transcriptional regulator, nickel/cobalt-responsive transcriptional repressor